MKTDQFYWGKLCRTGSLLCIAVLIFSIPAAISAGDARPDLSMDPQNTEGDLSLLPNIPLFFVPNSGQADPAVLFTCKGSDFVLYFMDDRVLYSLPIDGDGGHAIVEQRFSGASPDPKIEGRDPLETRISYFRGVQSEWHTNITPFGAVTYRGIYPGIDVIYRGEPGRVKREFVVSPGADPYQIRMIYPYAGQVRMTGDGGLAIFAGSGEIRESSPFCYQEVGEKKVEIPCRFDIREDDSVSFYLGPYDRTLPLLIDPALVYCGYIGGSGDEYGNDIAVDASGNAYITGYTSSTEATFPEVTGPYLYNKNGIDAFVAKINPGGTGLVYCGYIGGDNTDWGNGIAVDTAGNAYIVGRTTKTLSLLAFPVTVGPGLVHQGGDDAFVAKVNPSGTSLEYCGFIGGTAIDGGDDIAVDDAGYAYVTGSTASSETSFPVTPGWDSSYNGGEFDAFVAKVTDDGTGLAYCGYLGGSGTEGGDGIAVDASGNAYITGMTTSTESSFPVSPGWDTTYNGEGDAFVAKINPTGYTLVYCSYLGGSLFERGNGIAVQKGISLPPVYVTGLTFSTESTFPDTAGPDLTYGGAGDAFIAKVDSWGAALTYCGYLGGSGSDEGYEIAVDDAGNVYVAGKTDSNELTFPVTTGPDLIANGGADAFVAKLNPAGNQFFYCGYIGGSSGDSGNGIAVNSQGDAFITGHTASTETSLRVYRGPDLGFNGGVYDAFAARVRPANTGLSRSSSYDNWIFTQDFNSVSERDHYGIASDKPLLGDFNNDGILDRAVFRNGNWILDYCMDGSVNSNTHFGLGSDIPLVFDFNRDGTTDRAVYRNGEWIIDRNMDGDVDSRTPYGIAGDIPLIGDFNNDGITDRAVFRASAWDNWILDYGMDGTVNTRNRYGQSGDIPVIGDFNRDGLTDRAVFRNGEWIIDYNMDGSVNSRPRFGMAGDVPVVWNR